jgi:hypothetical protein
MKGLADGMKGLADGMKGLAGETGCFTQVTPWRCG